MRFFLALLLWTSPVWAGISLPVYKQLNTTLGPVSVRQTDRYYQKLFINNQPLLNMGFRTVDLHGIYNHAGDGSQSVLLSTTHGGNTCTDNWYVLRISGNRIQPSSAFGGCASRVLALRADQNGLELDMPAYDPNIKFNTFRFSGQGFSEIPVINNDSNAPTAGTGPEVTRWLGKHPSEVFKDPSERRRFKTVMDEPFFKELWQATNVATRITGDGTYIYGAGCMPHRCNIHAGVYAIRIADGAVFAAIWRKNLPSKIAGGTLDSLPPRLRRFALTGKF